jgi:hypothetical protein
MANDEHVALLKQGVAAWNAWRREHPDIRPNLSGAYLADAHLTDDRTQSDLIDASVHMTMSTAQLSHYLIAEIIADGETCIPPNLPAFGLQHRNEFRC